MKILGIIQIRYGSKRLPGKALEKIGNKTILEHCIDSARHVRILEKIVVATGPYALNAPIIEECKRIKVDYYYNDFLDENDVLARFVTCLVFHPAEYVLRICGDAPFFSPQYSNELIDTIKKEKTEYDYIAHYRDNKPVVSTHPLGHFKEIIKSTALMKAHCQPGTYSFREHVTPIIYQNEHLFKIKKIPVKQLPKDSPDINTIEDLKRIRKQYQKGMS